MLIAQLEIQLIAILVAIACAIPGTFLVLRKMAMISDAISHSILPGIVIGFLLTQDLSSPWLILLAAFSGVLTVVLVEFISRSGMVKEDTAIGLVFPALFSIGVILISRKIGNVHIDIDTVLVGEIAFAPFDRLTILGTDAGPKALWVMGIICIISLALVAAFFKELKVSTFDTSLAISMGFSPAALHYGLMSITSVTTVGAFDAVGGILVVAFIIAPAATAYLLTNNLVRMLLFSILLGVFAAISGYWIAHWMDASIAGAISAVLGMQFFIIYLLAPEQGILSAIYKMKRQKREFDLITYLIHLNNHTIVNNPAERNINHMTEHLNWSQVRADKTLGFAINNGMIEIENNIVNLTSKGTEFTQIALDYIHNNRNSGIELIKDKFLLFRA